MIVEITMQSGQAVIESEDKTQHLVIPILGPLRARMRGEQKAKFHAEVCHGSLELGERIVEKKAVHG